MTARPPILIAAALATERAAVEAIAGPLEARTLPGLGQGDLLVGEIDGTSVALLCCGVGKVASATSVTAALALNPRCVISVGSAGSLQPGRSIGDVVISTEVLQHDFAAVTAFAARLVPLAVSARFPRQAIFNVNWPGVPPGDITVKAIGKQWYWSYNYPDSKFEFDSLMLQEKDRKPDQPRLLAVDNEMVVPVNKVIRVQVIGSDVIHAFAVPSFGVKIDAIPGRLNETWFKATKEGMYYGQCSELCGKDHAYMPIAVRVVSDKDYAAWIDAAKKKYASTDTPRATTLAAAE